MELTQIVFFKYFSKISNTIFTSEIPEADTFVGNRAFSEECYNDDSPLNSPITVNEILEAVKTLKRGKPCGNDFLLSFVRKYLCVE